MGLTDDPTPSAELSTAGITPEIRQLPGTRPVPHGFRSSFRDWAAEETNHTREVIEAAYARSDLFERRRILMDDRASNQAQGAAKDSKS